MRAYVAYTATQIAAALARDLLVICLLREGLAAGVRFRPCAIPGLLADVAV